MFKKSKSLRLTLAAKHKRIASFPFFFVMLPFKYGIYIMCCNIQFLRAVLTAWSTSHMLGQTVFFGRFDIPQDTMLKNAQAANHVFDHSKCGFTMVYGIVPTTHKICMSNLHDLQLIQG